MLCDVNGAFCHGSKMWVLSVKRFGWFWLNFGQYILCYPWACLSFYFDFRFHFLDAMHVMLNRECLGQGINIISMTKKQRICWMFVYNLLKKLKKVEKEAE